MNPARWWCLVLLAFVVLGCSGKSIAGSYHIEQDGNGFGPGAEKTELVLKGDKNFNVTIGSLTLFEGKWKEENGEVTLTASKSSDQIATSYKVKDKKLIPYSNGKEITFYRWVPK